MYNWGGGGVISEHLIYDEIIFVRLAASCNCNERQATIFVLRINTVIDIIITKFK